MIFVIENKSTKLFCVCVVVTIPGALFLSLVFDERCATGSADDFLQLYEDIDCKESFGEK